MAQKFTKEEREQLEQDPLHRFYSRVEAFFYENYTTIISVGVAVIVAVALSVGYYYYSQSQEDAAQEMLGFAEELYRNGQYEKALTGDQQNMVAGFNEIIDNYSGTDAGNLAHYYAAVCEYQLGNPEEALSHIQQHVPAEGILGVGPVSFHAVVLNELGRHEEASAKFVEAAEWDENEATTPYNLLQAAESNQLAGNLDRAYDLAQRVMDEYPDNQLADQAKRLKGRLMTAVQQ